MLTNEHDLLTHQPASPHASWVGWLSLALATAGMILIGIGDPLWLGLPSSVASVMAGRFAIGHGQEKHLGAHLGVSLGVLNLFFWVMLILIVGYLFQIDPTSVFEIPDSN